MIFFKVITILHLRNTSEIISQCLDQVCPSFHLTDSWNVSFKPSHISGLLTFNLISCQIFFQLLLFMPFVAPVQTFYWCCCQKIHNPLIFSVKWLNVSVFNIILTSTVNEMIVDVIIFLFTFFTAFLRLLSQRLLKTQINATNGTDCFSIFY